jgi:hypothetical protein
MKSPFIAFIESDCSMLVISVRKAIHYSKCERGFPFVGMAFFTTINIFLLIKNVYLVKI